MYKKKSHQLEVGGIFLGCHRHHQLSLSYFLVERIPNLKQLHYHLNDGTQPSILQNGDLWWFSRRCMSFVEDSQPKPSHLPNSGGVAPKGIDGIQ